MREVNPSRKALFIAQSGCCFLCGQPMLMGPARKTRSGLYNKGWTIEHVIPKSLGGRNLRNVVLSHHLCNTTRKSEPVGEEKIALAQEIISKALSYHSKFVGRVFSISHRVDNGFTKMQAAK